MVKITRYICICNTWFDSEYMTMEEAMPIYQSIYRQAMRGLRQFPELVDINNNIVEV